MTKKRGRPKGSRNAKATVIEKPLSRCRSCESTEFSVLRSATRNIVGTSPDGSRYTSVTHRRVKCKRCGAVTMFIEKPFDPDIWNSKREPTRL